MHLKSGRDRPEQQLRDSQCKFIGEHIGVQSSPNLNCLPMQKGLPWRLVNPYGHWPNTVSKRVEYETGLGGGSVRGVSVVLEQKRVIRNERWRTYAEIRLSHGGQGAV